VITEPDPGHEATNRHRRAQSHVIGVVLLVGVVALVTVLFGAGVVGNVLDEASEEPLVDGTVTANESTVTLVHGGGDDFAVADASVVLRRGGERTVDLWNFTDGGDGDDQFEPGERRSLRNWNTSELTGTGPLRVLVVHEPTNSVVVDETVDVG